MEWSRYQWEPTSPSPLAVGWVREGLGTLPENRAALAICSLERNTLPGSRLSQTAM